MMAVVATRVVPLGTQPLYPYLLPPALESPGTGFDAPDGVRPGEDGDFRVADARV